MEKRIQIDPKAHALEMLLEMKKLREYCDFTIKVGPDEIPVHKHVLAASSPYFKAMLSHDNLETRSGVVEMKEADAESVKKCIDFIYTGKASVSDDKRADLMHVAHMMQLHRLCDGLGLFLEENLSVESFFHIKHMADTYNCKKLGLKCDEFAFENFKALANMGEFNHLNGKYILFLMSCKENKVPESIKCKALIKWTMSDKESRKQVFEKIFHDLDLVNIPLSYQRYLVQNEELIFSCNEILKKLLLSTYESFKIEEHDENLRENSAIGLFEFNSQSLLSYDPHTQTFAGLVKMNDAMNNHGVSAVVALGYDIYVLLGYGHTIRLKTNDIKRGWEVVADQAFSTRSTTATALGGFIYASPNDSCSTEMERYDPHKNIWERIPNKALLCVENSLVAKSKNLYSIGGKNQSNISIPNVEQFDPVSETWCEVGQMNKARHSAAAVEFKGKIYVLGGNANENSQGFRHNRNANENSQGFGRNRITLHNYFGQLPRITTAILSDVECFDPDIGTWTNLVSMPIPRSNFSACILRSDLFVVGGDSGKTIQRFDLLNENWEKETSLPSDCVFSNLCFAIE